MTLTPNSSTALRGAAATTYGRSTIERALDDHQPAEPDRDHLAGQLDQARRGIGGAAESTPDQGRDER